MYIIKIVLDGFKSYKVRTEVDGFDKEFTAITGFNGSGKSNILDAICFVLGITTLSQVRATQLQDLVYKNGQAGVVKATVSITFDNSNKDQCPPGYEDFKEITVSRQVIIGGKNKYMINGVTVQNKRVQDLFCSCQMNVNNPNFLIMQGRITKVLNMKPLEILSMIEEAAGTHMYEVKKLEAIKAIEKKDAKLSALVKILEQEIRPKLEKLKSERKQYLHYQEVEREVGHLQKLWCVQQLMILRQQREVHDRDVKKLQNDINMKNQKIEESKAKILESEKEITEMKSKIDEEAGGDLKLLEKKLKEREKQEAHLEAECKQAKETIKADEKAIKQLEKTLQDDKNTLEQKRSNLEKMNSAFSNLRETQASDAAALKLAEKRLEAASSGQVVGESGEVATIEAQLMTYRQEASEAKTLIKQTEMDMNYAATQLKKLEQKNKNTSSDLETEKNNLKILEKKMNSMQEQLAALTFDEKQADELEVRRVELLNQTSSLRRKVELFENKHPRAAFGYKDPEPNFNRRRIPGLVCKLFQVKRVDCCTALETAAGGRLYNVVVDTDATGKILLKNGQLQQRVTIIPLNKIQSSVLKDSVVRTAQSLVGSSNVFPALSVVSCDQKVLPAIKYIFGNVLICKDIHVAKKVAFDSRIMTRCVTLDGDSVDPRGVLSGGSAGQTSTLLMDLHQLKDTINHLTELEQNLEGIQKELEKISATSVQYKELKQRCDFSKHEYDLLQNRLQQTSHYRQMEEINQLKVNIEEMTKKIETAKQREKHCQSKIKEIESQIADATGYRERQLKEAQTEVERMRKKAESSKKEWSKKENDYDALTLEVSELTKGIEASNEQIIAAKSALEAAIQKYDELKATLSEAKTETADIQQQVQNEKQIIEERNAEIQSKVKKNKQLTNACEELKLEIHSLNLQLNKLETEGGDWETKEQALFDNNPWLEEDTYYTREVEALSTQEKKQLETKYKKLNEEYKKLGRQVNTRALSLLEAEEDNFKRLMDRKCTVENDKKVILASIDKFDRQIEQAIIIAYETINKNFSSIFQSLLPNVDVKLSPLAGQKVVNGLEVKVRFGNVWKESLTELSGGQRSLIALSLILAMLLFKPAPIYILDEVDAALDLSHTQNIGHMLRTHFKNSQFIVVSLKDGMFNNANVVFRTSFVDGVSTIARTVCRK